MIGLPLESSEFLVLRRNTLFNIVLKIEYIDYSPSSKGLAINRFQQANSDQGAYLIKWMRENKSPTVFWIGVLVKHHRCNPLSSYTALDVWIILPFI